MNTAIQKLDDIMDRASRALADMDYLTCESMCMEALAEARDQKCFRYYARVLMPLQEARRQRRMIAAQGEIRLGTAGAGFDTTAWLHDHKSGCIVMTHPHTAEDAKALAQQARSEKLFVEVLFADNTPDNQIWTLRSYDGREVSCRVSAPTPDQNPAQWFLHATEQLGDAALLGADDALTGEALIHDLEARLRAFPDHELLHQRLAQAAQGIA